jgi:hypothetical protein
VRTLCKGFVISALLPVATFAAEPVALVLDVSGAVQPEVALYDEVAEGAVFELEEGAHLTLSHYGLCEEVAVTGGTVSVGSQSVDLDGSQVESRTRVQCPHTVVMTAADTAGTAAAPAPSGRGRVMAPTPDFVLAGRWGRQFDQLDVHGKNGRMAILSVVDGRASWPEEVQPLTIGESYVVALSGPGAQQHAARIEVTGEPQGMTVLKGRRS